MSVLLPGVTRCVWAPCSKTPPPANADQCSCPSWFSCNTARIFLSLSHPFPFTRKLCLHISRPPAIQSIWNHVSEPSLGRKVARWGFLPVFPREPPPCTWADGCSQQSSWPQALDSHRSPLLAPLSEKRHRSKAFDHLHFNFLRGWVRCQEITSSSLRTQRSENWHLGGSWRVGFRGPEVKPTTALSLYRSWNL